LNSSESARSFSFQRFGNFSVCLDQSLSDVARFFLIGFAVLRLDSLGLSRAQARLASKAVFLSRIRPSRSTIDLPVFGHIALQVHRGHKVIDFDQKTVTKIFHDDVTQADADHEIFACKRASKIAVAPKFLGQAEAPVRYSEEYIAGTLGTRTDSALAGQFMNFYDEIEKCLLGLIADNERPIVDSFDYIQSLAGDSYGDRWLKNNIGSGQVARVTSYQQALVRWLNRNADTKKLQLVQSHGDFSLVNTISTDAGLRFIDWEGLAPGGLYSDIFNFAFVERYYERAASNLIAEVSSMLQKYRAAVISRYPDLSAAANIDPVFARRLYYLERLRILCNREASQNLADVVARSIQMFQAFDIDAGQRALTF
jgi:hypothetical protein